VWQVAHDSRNLSIAGKSGASMAFKRIMERARVAAGIAPKAEQGSAGRNVSARSFHSFRHGVVTALAHANVSMELRQKLAGHASEEQSLHYTHPEFAVLRSAIEKLPGLKENPI
jgi:integrase